MSSSTKNGIVLDCSLALALFLDDERPPLSEQLVAVLPYRPVWVPRLWHYEFAHAIVVALRRQRVNPERARQILDQAQRLPLHHDVDEVSLTTLFMLADKYGLSAYGAAYLELALRRKLALATLDHRLVVATMQAGGILFNGVGPQSAVQEPRASYRIRMGKK